MRQDIGLGRASAHTRTEAAMELHALLSVASRSGAAAFGLLPQAIAARLCPHLMIGPLRTHTMRTHDPV